MCDMLFKILVVEAAEGNKPSNKFEPKSLEKVAEEIGAKFNIKCHSSHVHYRLCTVRKEWKIIQDIQKKKVDLVGMIIWRWSHVISKLMMMKCWYEIYINEFFFFFLEQ